jgi:hypothetical protein
VLEVDTELADSVLWSTVGLGRLVGKLCFTSFCVSYCPGPCLHLTGLRLFYRGTPLTEGWQSVNVKFAIFWAD